MANFFREEAGCQRCCFKLEMWHWLEWHLKSRKPNGRLTLSWRST
jgi:hypothetical protein